MIFTQVNVLVIILDLAEIFYDNNNSELNHVENKRACMHLSQPSRQYIDQETFMNYFISLKNQNT